MGMSGDFEAAIAEGATLVRVGSALFGEREYQGRAGQTLDAHRHGAEKQENSPLVRPPFRRRGEPAHYGVMSSPCWYLFDNFGPDNPMIPDPV